MSKDNQVNKPDKNKTPGSGSGADSALEAMIRKRPPRGAATEQPEQQPQHRARPQPDAGT